MQREESPNFSERGGAKDSEALGGQLSGMGTEVSLNSLEMPDSVTMMRRLVEFDDNSRATENLYPRICGNVADRQMAPVGAVTGILTALNDYIYVDGEANGFVKSVLDPLMGLYLDKMNGFISAVIADDAARAEALNYWMHVIDSNNEGRS